MQEQKTSAAELYALAGAAQLSPAALKRALELTRAQPDARDWYRFLDRLLLAAGGLLLLAGIVFFFAYNWDDLGRLHKLALTQALVVAAALAAWWRGFDTLAGKAALTAAIFLIGVVLAVFGQVYQTGADTYELFLVWTLLALPWVLAARFAPAWLLWVLLGALALQLYFGLNLIGAPGRGFFSFERTHAWLPLSAWLATTLLVWEFAQARGIAWLQRRAEPRVIALLLLATLTVAVLHAILGGYRSANPLAPLVYMALMSAGLAYYRLRRLDLAMLALGATSLIIVVTAALVRALLSNRFEAGMLLLIAFAVIGMSAAAAYWIRALAQKATA